eukprot:7513922-Pyramimonas_sp.AAC.1
MPRRAAATYGRFVWRWRQRWFLTPRRSFNLERSTASKVTGRLTLNDRKPLAAFNLERPRRGRRRANAARTY